MAKRPGRKASTPATIAADQQARIAFLEGLASGLTVSEAVKLAKVDRRTVYRWREADKEFGHEWDAAYDEGTDVFEAEARRRAVEGVEEPIVAMGKVARNDDGTILTVRRYSDTLLLASVKKRKPAEWRERYDLNATVKHSGGINVSINGPDADL